MEGDVHLQQRRETAAAAAASSSTAAFDFERVSAHLALFRSKARYNIVLKACAVGRFTKQLGQITAKDIVAYAREGGLELLWSLACDFGIQGRRVDEMAWRTRFRDCLKAWFHWLRPRSSSDVDSLWRPGFQRDTHKRGGEQS